MLAETVSIDGGVLVVFLVIALLLLAVAIAVIVFGFVLAPRAARGSSNAMGWWIVILVIEGAYCLGALAAVVTGDITVWSFAPLAIVAGQIGLFVATRRGDG